MLFYFQDQECSCQMYMHQSCTEACSTEGPDPKLGGDMRDSATSIPLLVLIQATDGKWPIVFRDTLWKQRAGGCSWCLTVCTALGDNYTPHPTLYYHLSNSFNCSGWATDCISPWRPGKCGWGAEGSYAGWYRVCLCMQEGCAYVCRALWYLPTIQQATDLQLPNQRIDSDYSC